MSVIMPPHWHTQDYTDWAKMNQPPVKDNVFKEVYDYAVWLDGMVDMFGVTPLSGIAFLGPYMLYAVHMQHVQPRPNPDGLPLLHQDYLTPKAHEWLNHYKRRVKDE